MDERRKNDRIETHNMPLQVVNDIDGEQLGALCNLSQHGMMLALTRQLYSDGILQLKIKVPAGLGGGSISMGVRILWCTPANSPNEYWAGLQTIDIGPADRNSLQSVLERLSGTA